MVFRDYYQTYKRDFIETVDGLDFEKIAALYAELDKVLTADKQVFVIGNGGSAATAAHWACDFGKGVNVADSKRFKVTSLADNMAWVSALGNDISYGAIFVEQLKNRLDPGDLLIGLSVSGQSENVSNALAFAQEKGAATASLIGNRQGKMKDYSDLAIVIPSDDYGIVEDVHMFVNHVISQYIRKKHETSQDQPQTTRP
ncbi:SIS domain-containing protein [Thalassobacillus pellis]|uniref:SIS domain-containing protein n=1 Tax=Thalassobacillus pellis TaxID=748008 RepID=UPI0019607C86|nr:SIS domain-containing protein [Thalassobacillus pellis]MBM7551517.1 D-sedoheptulose 7-phosphate isomerase [Thalassobacillus pellis]